LTAKNSVTPDGTQTFTLTVSPQRSRSARPICRPAPQGDAYQQTIAAAGGTAPYNNFTISTGALPAGLAINAATGVLSGTPTVNGTFPFTIAATDSSGGTGPYTQGQNYTLTINPPLAITTVMPATYWTVNAPGYSQTIATPGGIAPITSASARELAAGLGLSTTTGIISGTPSTAGSSTFTITATDSANGSDSKSYNRRHYPSTVRLRSDAA